MRPTLLWFDGPVALLAVCAASATWVAWDRTSAWPAAWWWWAGALTYVAVSRLSAAKRWWRPMALAAAIGGALVGLFVVLQYAHLQYDVKFAALDRIGRSTSRVVPRLSDWTPMSNSVATLVEGLVPLAVALAFLRGPLAPRIVAGASGAVMLWAILLVASRGAWVALAGAGLAAAVAWGWANRRESRGQRVLLACGLVAVTVGVAVAGSAGAGVGLETAGQGSPAGRLAAGLFDRPDRVSLYEHGLTLVRDFWFTGIGAGDQFAMALSRYALLIEVPFLTYAHNLPLGIWLELGLPGIAAWVALIGAIAGAVVAGERAGGGIRFRGAWVGLLAVTMHGMVDARQLVDRWTWLPFFVLLGLLSARIRRQRVRPTLGAAAAPVVLVVALLVWVAAWVWPIRAAWSANRGALAQATAELGFVSTAERVRLASEARRHFGRALTVDAGQVTARRRLGMLSMNDERFDEAYAHLAVAWTADGDRLATRKAYGLACAWTGRLDESSQVLQAVPGIVDELNAWSSHWEGRHHATQAQCAARVSLLLRPSQAGVTRRLIELERRHGARCGGTDSRR